MVLKGRLIKLVNVNVTQCGFLPDKSIIYVMFILRSLHEEYRVKGKWLCMCFVDLVEAFDRVTRKVLELVVRKKGILSVLVRSVMSLYEGAKTRVRVDSDMSR